MASGQNTQTTYMLRADDESFKRAVIDRLKIGMPGSPVVIELPNGGVVRLPLGDINVWL